jgi:hypothetical protein
MRIAALFWALAFGALEISSPATCLPLDPATKHFVARFQQQDDPSGRLDPEQLRAAGLRELVGRHLTVWTDVPDRADIDELPAVFDQAVPQWCAYFGIDPATAESWHMTCFVMVDRQRFARVGACPDSLPAFPAGYQMGYSMWAYVQPGNYYTRHLVLHEGTHAFMHFFLGGVGPAWYAEGMAELMGVHRWAGGRLELKAAIADRDDVPHWGRVKIIREAYRAGQAWPLEDVLRIDPVAFRDVDSYAWAWAACELMDRHPRWHESFRKLAARAADSSSVFTDDFIRSLGAEWPLANREWQLLVANIEYGYDVARMTPTDVVSRREEGSATVVELAADHGWQSTGIELAAQQPVRITASGEFQIAHDGEQPWPSQPGGVTIRYHDRRPLGLLLAAVAADDDRETGLVNDQSVGREGTLVFSQPGTLYLRLNDSPAELADNAGTCTVRIEPVPLDAPRPAR